MNNIIPFPKRKKAAKPLPKKRIFYLGSVRAGNEETDLYAKRMRTTSGQRKWGIINYYSEQDNIYQRSLLLDTCSDEKLPEMVDKWVDNQVSLQALTDMGWSGNINHQAKVFTINHKCYYGVSFPKFTRPLHSWGPKLMAQGSSANILLEGKGLYAFTIYDHYVWMNLSQVIRLGLPIIKTVPVKLVGRITTKFLRENFVGNGLVHKINRKILK